MITILRHFKNHMRRHYIKVMDNKSKAKVHLKDKKSQQINEEKVAVNIWL